VSAARARSRGRAQAHLDMPNPKIIVGLRGNGEAEVIIESHEVQLSGEDDVLCRIALTTETERLIDQPAAEPASAQMSGDGNPADPDRHLHQAKISGELAVHLQQQMPSVLVEAVEIGIGGGLFDDEDALAEAKDLVQRVRRELLEALPLHRDLWHAGHRRSSEKAVPCSHAITARFLMSRSGTAQSSNGPAALGSRSGSSPISSSFR